MKTILAFMLMTMSLSVQASVKDQIMVKDGYVREVPPNQTISAAFMTIQNNDLSDHKLVSASSSAAKVVELHSHIHEDGMMKMRQIPQIDLPAGADVMLKPGGLHIMLINLTEPLSSDKPISLTLKFEDASEKVLTLPVKSMGNMKQMKH
jgi:copper(I)-binding protein